MINERVDEETLAAFLDGTLPPGERARVLRVLATSPEAYADFLDAAQVAAAVGAGSGTTAMSPKGRNRWRRSVMFAGPLLAAAGIAGVIFLSRGSRSGDTIGLMQGAQLAGVRGAGSLDASLGADWDQPGWAVVRGSEGSAASAGLTARVGARVAQLEFAASAADTVAWQRVAGSLAGQVTSIEGAGPIAQQLRAGAVPDAKARAALARQLRELSGTPAAFDVGAWLETARLAAASGRLEFFRPDGQAIVALRSLTSDFDRAPPPGAWTETRAQLRALEAPGTDLPAIRLHVDSAMAALPR